VKYPKQQNDKEKDHFHLYRPFFMNLNNYILIYKFSYRQQKTKPKLLIYKDSFPSIKSVIIPIRFRTGEFYDL